MLVASCGPSPSRRVARERDAPPVSEESSLRGQRVSAGMPAGTVAPAGVRTIASVLVSHRRSLWTVF